MKFLALDLFLQADSDFHKPGPEKSRFNLKTAKIAIENTLKNMLCKKYTLRTISLDMHF